MWRPFGHPVARCCDMLGVVGSNLKMVKSFMTIVDFALCCSRLVRFVQQCYTQACALVPFSIPNMSQHFAAGWPNAPNMLHATMLQYAALKCCYRVLARACKCWTNNVGICNMLRSFGRGLKVTEVLMNFPVQKCLSLTIFCEV